MANRTQVAGRLASLPAPIVTAVTPGYNGPNVPISYEQANGFQEAICRPLEDGNVVLDKDDYDQFAVLLSGVHAIKSNIRSDVETTGVTTVATSAAVACETTICSGSRSFAGGGANNANSGTYSASSGGHSNTNSGAGSASSGGYQNTNSGIDSASSGGYQNTNSGDGSASLGGYFNTNSGDGSASSGGSNNTNSGDGSASLGGYFNTNSGDGSASLGGYVTYNSGDRAVNCASRYAENIDDNCAFGGHAAAAPANHGDGATNKNIKWKLHNDTGNAEFSGKVKATGGLSTVTPAKFVAAYDLTDMRWEVTIDAIGGIIEIPFDSSFPLDGAILKMTNSKFGAGSRMYCQPVAPPTLTQTHGFAVNINTDGEMYFHDLAAAIEETVQVWFDIINPV